MTYKERALTRALVKLTVLKGKLRDCWEKRHDDNLSFILVAATIRDIRTWQFIYDAVKDYDYGG